MERLERSSVYYAATQMEATLCRRDPVTVVGRGNSAGQASVFLAQQGSGVNLVIRHHDLGRDMSRYLGRFGYDVGCHGGCPVEELGDLAPRERVACCRSQAGSMSEELTAWMLACPS